MDMDVVGNKERLLKGILDGETTTDIEPVGHEEILLKAILEKLGGGGGGATSVTLAASGDNLSGDISLADLKTALSNGVVLLSFPTEGNADERVVAEYTDDSTNGLRIGVFSEDEYIVYSVVDDGNDGVTLTVVSTKYMVEPFVIVPTFTSLTGGTVPTGTYSKLQKAIHNNQTILVDESAAFGQSAGTLLGQFFALIHNGVNRIYLRFTAPAGSDTTITQVTVYEIAVSHDDTFTMASGTFNA